MKLRGACVLLVTGLVASTALSACTFTHTDTLPRRVYATTSFGIVPVTITEGHAGKPIKVPGQVTTVLLTPAGRMAYQITPAGLLIPITVAANVEEQPISIPTASNSAILDAAHHQMYVRTKGGIVPVDLTSFRVGGLIPVTFGQTTRHPPLDVIGTMLYIVNDEGIVPINTRLNTESPVILLPGGPGRNPQFCAIPHSNLAFVTTQTGIVPFDTATQIVGPPIISIHAADHPKMISTPTGAMLFVDTGEGTVLPIHLANEELSPAIPLPSFDSGLLFATVQGTIYAITYTKRSIDTFSATNSSVSLPIKLPVTSNYSTTGFVGTPSNGTSFAITSTDTTLVLASSGSAVSIDLATGTIGKVMLVPAGTHRLVMVPGGKEAILATVEGSVPLDLVGDRVLPPLPGAGPATGILMSPDGRTLYATVTGSIIPINTSTNAIGNPIALKNRVPFYSSFWATPTGRMLFKTYQSGTIIPITLRRKRVETTIYEQLGVVGMFFLPHSSQALIQTNAHSELIPFNTITGRLGESIGSGGSVTMTIADQSAYFATTSGIDRITIPSTHSDQVVDLHHVVHLIFLSQNGRTLYATTYSTALTPIDVAAGTVGKPIAIHGLQHAISIESGGKFMYVLLTQSLLAFDMTTTSIVARVHLQGAVRSLAVSPDGASVLVVSTTGITSFDPTTLTIGSLIKIPGMKGRSLAMSP